MHCWREILVGVHETLVNFRHGTDRAVGQWTLNCIYWSCTMRKTSRCDDRVDEAAEVLNQSQRNLRLTNPRRLHSSYEAGKEPRGTRAERTCCVAKKQMCWFQLGKRPAHLPNHAQQSKRCDCCGLGKVTIFSQNTKMLDKRAWLWQLFSEIETEWKHICLQTKRRGIFRLALENVVFWEIQRSKFHKDECHLSRREIWNVQTETGAGTERQRTHTVQKWFL